MHSYWTGFLFSSFLVVPALLSQLPQIRRIARKEPVPLPVCQSPVSSRQRVNPCEGTDRENS